MFPPLLQLQITQSDPKRHSKIPLPIPRRQHPRNKQPQLPSPPHLHTIIRRRSSLLPTRSLLTPISLMLRQTLLSMSILVFRLLSNPHLANQSMRPHDLPLLILDGQTTLNRPQRSQYSPTR